MIPKEGAAFLAPLFGNWAGKDDMTKYFFKDTPLAGLEQQMMTPPNFTPRGGGQMILCRFRYRPEDVDCKNCTEYRKKRDTLRVMSLAGRTGGSWRGHIRCSGIRIL